MSSSKPAQYRSLKVASVDAYVRSRPELSDIFHTDDALDIIEVGDGNLNLVFKIIAKADPKQCARFLKI